MDMFRRLMRRLLWRPPKAREPVRRGAGRRVRVRGGVHLAAANAAYRQAMAWGERASWFAQEALEVPAYEDRALRGERSPHRFRWRGRWYRVVAVNALWRDGRTSGRSACGRTYFSVATEPRGLFQLYYSDRRKGKGQWVLYRKTEIRPDRV